MIEAAELNGTHIGHQLTYNGESGELRQIYHEGDYPYGYTYVYIGAGDPLRELQLPHTDRVSIVISS